jgi:GcrA cell cycle regulator
MQDFKIKAAPSPSLPIGWTQERTELALRWWRNGLSAQAIAERLGGVSRCAVLSKMYRHRALTGRAAPAPLRLVESSGRAKRARTKRDINRSLVGPAASSAEAAARQPPPRPPRVLIDPQAFAPLPGSRPRPWETRRWGECAWPVDMQEAGEATYSCCRPAVKGRDYCGDHRRMALDPSPPGADALKAEADQLVAWLIRRGG